MNPYGVSGNLFTTEADQSANGFMNPTSPSHLGSGWGIDASQLTPSYDAAYRPRFNGPSPYASYRKPGFFGAINNTFNPMVATPYWGNPIDHANSSADAFGYTPVDATMRVGQRFVAPAIAYGLSQKLLTGTTSYSMFTRAGWANGGGWAAGVGKSLGMGLGEGLGLGARGAGMMGSVGAAGMTIALPMAVGYAVTTAIDHAVFQPYAQMRQISNDLRSNFSGVTFGDARGNVITGGGLGRVEAGRMAGQLQGAGAFDQTWSSAQFGEISNMAGKSGLLDGAKSKQIINQIKSVSEQIKLITAISGDPSIQSAMEDLGKMRMAGASTVGGNGSEAAAILRGIKTQATAAGTSYQHMLNGIGLQGQYMYGMNGLTPVLGQLAGATAEAGFYAARRNGVFSDAQFARMGGESGGAQSVLAGRLAGYQTPYNQMAQMNRYMFGKSNNSLVDTMSNYGAGVASGGPMRARGMQLMHGGAMSSLQEKEGWLSAEDQAIEILKNQGMHPGPDGKWNPYEVSAVMEGNLGLTGEQIRAHGFAMGTASHQGSIAQRLAANNVDHIKKMSSFITQNNLGMGITQKGAHNLIDLGGEFTNALRPDTAMESGGTLSDAWQKTMKYLGQGNALEKSGWKVEDAVESLDKVVGIGGGTGSLSNLEVLKQAKEIVSYYASHADEDPSKSLPDQFKSGKYKSLQKVVQGMEAGAAFGKIKDILMQGLSTGSLRDAEVYKSGMKGKDFATVLGGDALGMKFTPGSNMTLQQLSDAATMVTEKADADARIVASKHSQTGWDQMIATSNRLDSAAVNMNQAANIIKESLGRGDLTKGESDGSGAGVLNMMRRAGLFPMATKNPISMGPAASGAQ